VDGSRLAVIAGPCVAEDAGLLLEVATELRRLTGRLGLPFVFKSSYLKDNRSSTGSYRGPGLEAGLRLLDGVRSRVDVPILSDVHAEHEVPAAAAVLDALQIPAFLCRQTDLLVAAAETGLAINVKKGQFLAPWDMRNVVQKLRDAGNDRVLACERGASFGYNTLVTDFRALPIMAGQCACPVIFDATHSVQLPGGTGSASGGQREFIAPLARAAVAAGIDGLFLEIHPDPDRARCDGPNSIPLDQVEGLLRQLLRIREAVV
jgi:2-dehydro-3-deoxyphosphooctonate aldolase (KDO 8-P synthase)